MAKAVILPIPFEATTSYGRGTSKGPQAIIKALDQVESYDLELDQEIDVKNVEYLSPLNCQSTPKDVMNKIKNKVSQHLADGKFIIGLGGEHSISQGFFQGICSRYKPCSILHLDAHADLRDEYQKTKYSHASVLARLLENTDNIVSVGVRSTCQEEKEFGEGKGVITYYAQELIKKNKLPIKKIVKKLKYENVFITIDLDVFNPSIMPSTGTPEPGGLLWYDVLALLRAVFKAKNVTGADIVELMPIDGLHHPNYLAAKLLYKLIGYKFFG